MSFDTRKPRPLRPLTHTAGRIERRGDLDVAEDLARAFQLRPEDQDLPIKGVHGLHPYPARMHPAWVRRLIELVVQPGPIVDPFCGSGTVLAESSLAGRESAGSDVNAMALRIARARTTRRDQQFLERFARAAVRVHGLAKQRPRSPFGKLAKGEKSFPPHVLTQLINLRDAIETEADPAVREALLLGFTPLLGKFAARPGRPAPDVNRRAVRDRFLSRCEQMTAAWGDFAETIPPSLPDPLLRRADARDTGWPRGEAAGIVSSPPYPGIYDYAGEQRLAAKWIGDDQWVPFAQDAEVGRRGATGAGWALQMRRVITEMVKITRPRAQIFLVVGDGVEDGRIVRADNVLLEIADATPGVRPVAAVSQQRPHFHGPTRSLFAGRPRHEHVFMMERA